MDNGNAPTAPAAAIEDISNESYDIYSKISLAIRGEKVTLQNAVTSCYNDANQHLVVANATTLWLYGNIIELGGECLGIRIAEENIRFELVLVLPWLNAYAVFARELDAYVQQNVVSADLQMSCVSHRICAANNTFYTAVANTCRKEVITADSDGGFKVWVLRSTTSQPSNGQAIKGFLRQHVARRNCHYRYLFLNHHRHTLIACTATRIHMYDTTTCARIGTVYKDTSRIMTRVSYDSQRDWIYVIYENDPTEVIKLMCHTTQGATWAGKLKIANEITACTTTAPHHRLLDNESLDSSFDGLVTLDGCGKLRIGFCCENTDSFSNETVASLPISPSTEAYCELHVDMRIGHRHFILAICTSGLFVVEAFIPGTISRRVVTNVAGSRMKVVTCGEQWHRVSIYNATPPSLLLLNAQSEDFYAMLLDPPAGVDSETIELVQYCAIPNGVAFGWSNGMTSQYNLVAERSMVIGNSVESMGTITTMTYVGHLSLVFVGYNSGCVVVWQVNGHTPQESASIGHQELHRHSISGLYNITPLDGENKSSVSIASISSNGEVKVWIITRHHQIKDSTSSTLSLDWHLALCFHTDTSQISSSVFMYPSFLFCGFEQGTIECWRLPLFTVENERKSQSSRRVAVIKRALHSFDVHLSSVCEMVVESGKAGELVASAQNHSDTFALTFMFPHRRIQVQSIPKGSYFARDDSDASILHYYAYIGRCLERLDQLTPQDKQAASGRVLHGRRTSLARELEQHGRIPHVHVPIMIENDTLVQNQAAEVVATTSKEPNRVCISMPNVPTVVKPLRSPSSKKLLSPSKRPPSAESLFDEPDIQRWAQTPMVVTNTDDEFNFVESVEVNAKVESSSKPLSTSVKQSSKTARSVKVARKSRGTNLDGGSYIPVTLPSQFQKSQPRVYHSTRILEAAARSSTTQTRVNVVGAVATAPGEVSSPCSSNSIFSSSFQSRYNAPTQEKVAIVSITNMDKSEPLRLDFQASKRHLKEPKQIMKEPSHHQHDRPNTPFLSWDALDLQQQQTEIMAATKSKGVIRLAHEEEVVVPLIQDFHSIDSKAQAAVHTFTQWYLARQQSKREIFLKEELEFAAADPSVLDEFTEVHGNSLSETCIGDVNSTEWQAFASWYSVAGTTISPEQRQRQLHFRLGFLNRRIQEVSVTNAIRCYIFDREPSAGEETGSLPVGVRLSDECRRKELVVALCDPIIQIAAMTEHIELPDISTMILDNVVIGSKAVKFEKWWKSKGNTHRLAFLEREIAEAEVDRAIQDILWKEQQLPTADAAIAALRTKPRDPVIDLTRLAKYPNLNSTSDDISAESKIKESDGFDLPSEGPIQDSTLPPSTRDGKEDLTEVGTNINRIPTNLFAGTYYDSDQAQLVYFNKKLEEHKREHRYSSMFKYGKFPVPVLIENVVMPLISPFKFPAWREQGKEDGTQVFDAELTMEANSTDAKPLDKDEADALRRANELQLMMEEDAMSLELTAMCEDSDSEEDAENRPTSRLEKRTDGPHSYFFPALPQNFRYGSHLGSGIDNGDEEIEEIERLEKERARLEELDRLETERVFQEEQEAAQRRIEKEKHDTMLHVRRQIQAELKRVLMYQSELELQRANQLELERVMLERNAMANEELEERRRLAEIDLERASTKEEDYLSTLLRKEEHDRRVEMMRKLIEEMTLMDGEDKRSLVAQRSQLQLEHKKRLRIEELESLYTPFEPYFAESMSSQEAVLPELQSRIHNRMRRSMRHPKSRYALPFAEAIAMDDVKQEVYVVRDSRKLRMLMGLSVSSPHSRRLMHIPSEKDILKNRKQQQVQLLPSGEDEGYQSDGERERDQRSKKSVRAKQSNQDSSNKRLPLLIERSSNSSIDDIGFTDLSRISSHTKKVELNKNQKKDPLMLPYFRGNFLVQGQGKLPLSD